MSPSPQTTPLPPFLSPLQTFSKMSVCVYMYVCVTHIICICAQSLQSCPTPTDPMYYSPPGSSVHGILQARILEWVAMPSSRGSSLPRDWTHVSCMSPALTGGFCTTVPPGNPYMFIYTHILSYSYHYILIPKQPEIRGTYLGHGLSIIYRWPSISMDPLYPRFCILQLNEPQNYCCITMEKIHV